MRGDRAAERIRIANLLEASPHVPSIRLALHPFTDDTSSSR
jgi:hypothetical protein